MIDIDIPRSRDDVGAASRTAARGSRFSRVRVISYMFAFAAGPAVAGQPSSPAAARAVVQRYYAAIDRRDFRRAYVQWGDGGRASGKTFDSFARGFASTTHTHAITGSPGRVEGAAGSLYVDVPVDVYAKLKDGHHQHFSGSYVVRRVNNVPGARAAELRWHIESAKLHLVR